MKKFVKTHLTGKQGRYCDTKFRPLFPSNILKFPKFVFERLRIIKKMPQKYRIKNKDFRLKRIYLQTYSKLTIRSYGWFENRFDNV